MDWGSLLDGNSSTSSVSRESARSVISYDVEQSDHVGLLSAVDDDDDDNEGGLLDYMPASFQNKEKKYPMGGSAKKKKSKSSEKKKKEDKKKKAKKVKKVKKDKKAKKKDKNDEQPQSLFVSLDDDPELGKDDGSTGTNRELDMLATRTNPAEFPDGDDNSGNDSFAPFAMSSSFGIDAFGGDVFDESEDRDSDSSDRPDSPANDGRGYSTAKSIATEKTPGAETQTTEPTTSTFTANSSGMRSSASATKPGLGEPNISSNDFFRDEYIEKIMTGKVRHSVTSGKSVASKESVGTRGSMLSENPVVSGRPAEMFSPRTRAVMDIEGLLVASKTDRSVSTDISKLTKSTIHHSTSHSREMSTSETEAWPDPLGMASEASSGVSGSKRGGLKESQRKYPQPQPLSAELKPALKRDPTPPSVGAPMKSAMKHVSPIDAYNLSSSFRSIQSDGTWFHHAKAKRRFLIVFVIMAVILGIGVILYFTVASGGSSETAEDIPDIPEMPESEIIVEEYVALFSQVSNPLAFNDRDSSQFKAVEWLVNQDELHADVDPSLELLQQRYSLAVFLFSMSVEDWLDPKLHECDWSNGIFCEQIGQNQVISLDFTGSALQGAIPPEIGTLLSLTSINLSENSVSGQIPSSLGDLTELKTLMLANNSLTGTIPPELSGLDQLTELTLNSNRLSGAIPDELEALISLRLVTLQDNSLEGRWPMCNPVEDTASFIVDCGIECACCSDCPTGEGL